MGTDDNYFDVILNCIDKLDYDDNVKTLFKEALKFEFKSNDPRYSSYYKKLIDYFSEEGA